jgi:hypothetical protein
LSRSAAHIVASLALAILSVAALQAQPPAPPQAAPQAALQPPAPIFPFAPPLGPLDAARLSAELRHQLEAAAAETPPNEARLYACRRALEEVILYAIEEDERRAALDRQEWLLVSREFVAPGEPRRVELTLQGRASRASALGFRAEGGRVLMENVEARDSSGERVPVSADALLSANLLYLRGDSPRLEICRLYAAGRARTISASLATDQAPGATVEILAALPKEPERAKLALHWLLRARNALSEYRLSDAARDLRRAERELGLLHREQLEESQK